MREKKDDGYPNKVFKVHKEEEGPAIKDDRSWLDGSELNHFLRNCGQNIKELTTPQFGELLAKLG